MCVLLKSSQVYVGTIDDDEVCFVLLGPADSCVVAGQKFAKHYFPR